MLNVSLHKIKLILKSISFLCTLRYQDANPIGTSPLADDRVTATSGLVVN